MTAERLPYERPTITRQVEGLMNKVGRPAPARACDEIEGVPVGKLVEQFGSPLFVFSEREIRRRVRDARQLFGIRYPKVQFAWSYKTNYLDAICAVFHSEGSWAEVVSAMEYAKARRLGVPGEHIIYNGPHKTPDSLRRAAHEGALINIDHLDELAELESIASAAEGKLKVGMRLNLDAGIIPQWHRFGFNLESGQAWHAVKRLMAGGRLELVSLHCHLGTFILDPSAYGRAVDKLLDFADALKAEFGITIRSLNLGGGFASTNTLHSAYLPGDQSSPSIAQYADALTEPLIRRRGGEPLTLLLESGRSLIDEAGSLIATVQGQKRLASGRRAIILDAGLNVLLTTWWYRLQVLPAQAASGIAEETVVYGPLCMNIDCLRESVVLPDLQRGDRVVVRPVGAYCFTQSMQFIALRPACVLIGPDGRVDRIRRAETLEDLVGPESLPDRLRLKQ